ncbi:MAG TPA: alanine--tRNA ligase, partial [Candidatus Gastranaerophilaceae bacterium]|nr:alanine--tRNA ligase [Candidatus Gastranaerophilaceae bacterium]
EKIKNTIKNEEEQFNKTLDRGYKLLEELLSKKQGGKCAISGEDAFKLYDTFGFPLELTVEIAKENGFKVDLKEFEKEMEEQKKRAKAAAQKVVLTDDLKYVEIEKQFGSTEFLGYEKEEIEAKIIAKVEGDNFVDIILDKTPFYAESGGQVGDTGVLENSNCKVSVLTTFKVNHLFVNRCEIIEGEVKIGDMVNAKIDSARREEIKIHHTNAHLLQAALKKVLGNEVKQAGSQVEENRTRFDFSYPRQVSYNELKRIEKIINDWIGQNLEVSTKVMKLEDAQKSGATALFGEKYENDVRVVSIGTISKELCGGTHIDNIGKLRLMKIVSESAIAAGTRRIEAVAGKTALEYLNDKEDVIDKIAGHLKTPYEEVFERIEKIQEENKSLQKELASVQNAMAKEKFASYVDKAEDIEGGKLFISKIDAMDSNALKEGVEYLAQRLGDSIIVIMSDSTIVAKVSDKFVANGINAGQIVSNISQLLGGKGGGRPQFAQGGIGNVGIVGVETPTYKNSLTDREEEILEQIVFGKSNTEIAKIFDITITEAKTHVCSILQKLSVQDRVQAAVKAIRDGLV